MAAIATSTLMTLAGRCRPCGSLAAMTSPVSRSATSHASAEMSLGSGGVPGAATTPQPASALPPSGLAGTGSGSGGSPTAGTSDESTAGGVVTRYGQLPVSGAALGSAPATEAAITAGTPTIAAAAAEHSRRRDAARKIAIDVQGRGLSPDFRGAAL